MKRRDIEPLEHGTLDVGDGHGVYWETWGDPNGIPVVFLHGGPGAGCSPGHRNFFDPDRYLVVFFDQRGCGRSRPLAREPEADLTTNTTQHLMRDMEMLRNHLGIDRWVVAGVSWGSTLGLAYAETHTDRVIGVVLAAVGVTTSRTVQWITEDVGRLFPREWERFSSFVPEELADLPLVQAYARLVFDKDESVRFQAAREWCIWEDTHVSLSPGAEPSLQHEEPGFQLEFARLVTHYWSNRAFLGETELIDNARRLNGTPGVLIHGKYDISSPVEEPWLISRAWESSELIIVDDSGHGGGSMLQVVEDALRRVTGDY